MFFLYKQFKVFWFQLIQMLIKCIFFCTFRIFQRDLTSNVNLKAKMIVLKIILIIIIYCVCNPEVYPNICKLIQVAITVPVSSVTCERSFSSMHCIKNWSRITDMLQNRFTNLLSLYIE